MAELSSITPDSADDLQQRVRFAKRFAFWMTAGGLIFVCYLTSALNKAHLSASDSELADFVLKSPCQSNAVATRLSHEQIVTHGDLNQIAYACERQSIDSVTVDKQKAAIHLISR